MYISNLSIKNFRNFTDFNIELKPFTLIIGENNTGKTNLLESLCLIFGQEISMFRRRILNIDDINYKSLKEFKERVCNLEIEPDSINFPEVKIEVVMTGFDDGQASIVGDWFIDENLEKAKLTYTFSLRQGWRNKIDWIKEERKKGDVNLVDFPIDEYEYHIYGGVSQNKADLYLLKMLKMELLDALRDAKKELIASGDYRLLYRILNNRDKKNYADIQKALVDLQGKVKIDPEFQKITLEIKTYLDKISLQEDDAENSVDFKFISPELCEILKKLSLIYGSNPISVERNGLGRNNLLYISLILSHLIGGGSGADSTFFRLIGIEEPESHLHPHLQLHLSKNIKSNYSDDLQIIITSHSPYIASQLDLGNMHIIYKEDCNIREHNLLAGIQPDSDTDRYLRKFLDATNSTMFFAKKIILVEGISEQILIPKLFEIYSRGKTLEKCGCNIVNVNGLAFKHFLEIIKNGYFIRCAVYTDNDGNSRAENLKKEFETGSDVIKILITSEKTFEKDLISVNKSGDGKNTLLDALCKTKPTNGNKLKTSIGEKDIDIDAFFSEIEKYKSAFSFDVLTLLEESKSINIPQYIKEGFDHLLKPLKNA